jgi:type IV secretion system protein VirB1
MILAPAMVLSLAAQCAPQAAPETLLALARVESGLDPLAIGVNGPGPKPRPRSADEAVATASRLIATGVNVDLGLTQINSANLDSLGLTVTSAFAPCRSVAAGAALLAAGYRTAKTASDGAQAAARTALSLYNTGDPQRGFRNGYVARVVAAAGLARDAPPDPPDPRPRAAWDAFGDLSSAAFVTSPSPSKPGSPP